MPPLILIAIPLSIAAIGPPHSADAHACVRAEPGGVGPIGALRNRCDFRVVAYMCVTGPPARDPHLYFDCTKGQVGSYDLKPGSSTPAILNGARGVHWFACRFPEYLPRNVQYHAGKGLRGRCE